MQSLYRLIVVLLLALPTVASAELPEGLVWDDPYTWFDVSEDSRYVNGATEDLGWKLQYKFRMFGDVPENSAFRLVLSRDGKELGSLRENGNRRQIGRPGFDWDRPLLGMSADSLVNWKTPIVGAGLYDLAVYYIDGTSLDEHLARRYTLDVRAAPRVRGTASNSQADGPHYYLNRHGDAAWSIVHQRPGKFPEYMADYYNTGAAGNSVTLYWNTFPRMSEKDGKTVASETWISGRLKAKVNGKRIDLGSQARLQQVTNKQVRQIWAEMSDRNAEAYRTGPPNKQAIRFAMYRTDLPLTWRDDDERHTTRQPSGSVTYEATPKQDFVALNDHPGEWEIEWVVNGETLRSWRFDVDETGRIQPWDETPGDITTGPHAHFVEMNIPEGGTSIDGRLTPDFVEDGALFGLGLPDEFADKVPEKGEPFPVPSVAEASTENAEQAAQTSAQPSATRPAAAELPASDIAEQREAEEPVSAPQPESAEPTSIDPSVDTSTGSGGLHGIVRVLLSLSLVATGIALAGASLGPLAGVAETLKGWQFLLGVVTLLLAFMDFGIDVGGLRPIIGDGLPQLAGFAAAGAAMSGNLQIDALKKLQGSATPLGIAALIAGVLHLVAGGLPVL